MSYRKNNDINMVLVICYKPDSDRIQTALIMISHFQQLSGTEKTPMKFLRHYRIPDLIQKQIEGT